MKKYHYAVGDNQFGPLTIEELKEKMISKDTMVWYEGLNEWIEAGEVEELKELFKSVPPPLNSNKQTPPTFNKTAPESEKTDNQEESPRKSKKGVLITIISVFLILTVIAIIVLNKNQNTNNSENNSDNNYENNSSYYSDNTSDNNSTDESSHDDQYEESYEESYEEPSPKTEEELKLELAITECAKPLKYLKLSNKEMTGIYKNAISMKFVGFKVKFSVGNSATLVTFKNIKCRVTLKSNSGSIILSEDFKVNEFVQAGNQIAYKGEFECTNQQYNDTDNYLIEILDAECH